MSRPVNVPQRLPERSFIRPKRRAAAPSQRQLRVGEELRHALAWLLERGEVYDPGIAGTTITITEVRVSPDLRNATAFVVPLGGGDVSVVLHSLTRARPFLRRAIAKSVRLRRVPNLQFSADESFDTASRIDHLLRQAAFKGGEDEDA
ncbi:MAG: 30S ribosome-binding factor RbfA [Rhodospirillales bacterium]